ncbi:helix-turn-helix transcriptional regulator [uncultured Alistipes sp.]|uniref:response regulator transcription factor n=1 Tax=uncultured Alistipes sp. TaxID=538949 RepID=UPI0025A5FAA5|nr:helix-turn-helix transcriptional regulator [uncultured Alistipes sp.]MCX4281521.1 helix-turn-helix transcriptional regulator [Alistipes sp.]
MDPKDRLNKEFSAQSFAAKHPYAEMLDRYKEMARNYARMENAVAVLSDLRTDASYIYYGGFSRMLRTGKCEKEGEVPSIWEEEIFKLIHPDDLADKHLQELRFFHFVKRQPKKKRGDYYLTSKLRMKNDTNNYIPVLHRMFYVPAPSDETLWLALCLYSPLPFDIPSKCLIINSVNGQTTELGKQHDTKILSVREKQVLNLIDKGLTSKEIAGTLSISIHTVSRHRQGILAKLQVKNSIEACRIAKDLKLI